ncbi:MAG: IS110 family transposase [Anaerolineae bacterium]|nr:IS110 family transposase [Anaerolineae bacterium]
MAELLTAEDQYLTTIPGLSTTLAAAILGEIGDIRRFTSLKPLIAFAGFDPTVYQSGQFQATQTSLSKRGSPYLRRAIWFFISENNHQAKMKKRFILASCPLHDALIDSC